MKKNIERFQKMTDFPEYPTEPLNNTHNDTAKKIIIKKGLFLHETIFNLAMFKKTLA